MKKTALSALFVLFSVMTFAQTEIWKKADESKLESLEKVRRKSLPREYQLFSLDLEGFKKQLIGAPVRGQFNGRSRHVITLPNSDGRLERFYVMETPIMEKGLADKFPMIKSYAAQGVDNPGSVARFSVTQFGLHNMTFSPGKSIDFIDPYTEDTNNYIVYKRSSLPDNPNSFECLTAEAVHLPSLEAETFSESEAFNANDGKLRTYRLALSCTGEYGAIFDGTGTTAQKKANIQAQMAITMTRVNGVYENDLGITMIFVANNDAIIYFNGSSDPWTGEYNVKTAEVIDAAIGFSNYDIGHNFNVSNGGGNAGCIGCVCSPDTMPSFGNDNFHKGTGMTGMPNPTGDAFDIDYVAHEMGHQFGGYHTQSSINCLSGDGTTEVEPGSGSTIMGYAGVCSLSIQNHSDAYFHYVTIRDIVKNVKSGVSSCGQVTTIANNVPTANAGRDYVIPRSTPFMLIGSGSDPDGDVLTYTWEQNDPQNPSSAIGGAPTANKAQGPMYRSIWGTTDPIRYMPDKTTVLEGNISNQWEVLSSVSRVLNFALTVRDNVAGGGQTASDLMKVTVNATAGPFAVTAPNTVVSYQGGSNQTVTWNVAGTTANGVDTPYVDIFLSTDGGQTFPVLLASKVPNDGSEIVTIPNTPGSLNRIMVKGHDNIFYDVSNTDFTITAANPTFAIGFSGTEGEQNKSVCKGSSITYTIPYTAIGGFAGTTNLTATGQPAGSTVSFSPASINATGNVLVTVTTTASSAAGFYTLEITGTSGATSKKVNLYLDLLNNNFSAVNLTSPINLAQVQSMDINLNWSASTNSTGYDIDIATDNTFSNIIFSASSDTNFYSVPQLPSVTTFYWRVKPRNTACSGSFSSTGSFKTIFCSTISSPNVPVAITALSATTVTSTLSVSSEQNITINDVNVNLDISHSNVRNLTVRITSPSGTQVQLFSNKCTFNPAISDVYATFDDAGSVLECSSTSPGISGVIIPAQALSAFNGQSSQGIWTLTVVDNLAQNGGQINNWSIDFCSAQAPLAVVDNTFTDFMVYPNPNTGNFNVQFTSNSSGKVKIAVYDIRGRVIYDNSYPNQGTFSQNIQLNEVQTGMYLLDVTDGERKEVRKIIIK
jgi:subtilisin-like proprotein convertase family protein